MKICECSVCGIKTTLGIDDRCSNCQEGELKAEARYENGN